MDPPTSERAVYQEPRQANRKALEKTSEKMEAGHGRLEGKTRKSVGVARGHRHEKDRRKHRPPPQWQKEKMALELISRVGMHDWGRLGGLGRDEGKGSGKKCHPAAPNGFPQEGTKEGKLEGRKGRVGCL